MKEPREIIADNLPTFAEFYKAPLRVILPTRSQLLEAADRIIDAIQREGYRIHI